MASKCEQKVIQASYTRWILNECMCCRSHPGKICDTTTMNVTCRIHGHFLVLAGNHLAGEGCPTCDKDKDGHWINPDIPFYLQHNKKWWTQSIPGTEFRCNDFNVHTNIVLLECDSEQCGNPLIHSPDTITKVKLRARDLYDATMRCKSELMKLGFMVKLVWKGKRKIPIQKVFESYVFPTHDVSSVEVTEAYFIKHFM